MIDDEIDEFHKKTGMKFGYGCHYHPKDAKDAWAMFRNCGQKFPDAEFFMVKVLGKREVMWQYGKEVVSNVGSSVL